MHVLCRQPLMTCTPHRTQASAEKHPSSAPQHCRLVLYSSAVLHCFAALQISACSAPKLISGLCGSANQHRQAAPISANQLQR